MSSTMSTLNTGLSDLSSGLGVYAGLERGGLQGDVGALASAGQLAGKVAGNSALNNAAGGVGDVLGIYSGIQQGGLAGYGTSAADTAKLAGYLSGDTALSTLGGYIAAPLSLYDFAKNWQSGNTGADALGGAEAGASIGSIVPGVGTVIGGLVGAAAGALSSAFGGGKPDPETTADKGLQSQYSTAYASDPQGATAALSGLGPQQSFESLAGYFDAKNNTAGHSQPIEQTFGRMQEGTFLDDIAGQLNSDYTSGAITPGESASQIYSSEISPWISSKTGGQGILGPQSGEGGIISGDIQNLIGDYTNGSLTSSTPLGVTGQQDSSLPAFAGLGAYAGSAAPAQGASASPATVNTSPDAVRQTIQHAPMARAATGGAMRKVYYDDGGGVDMSLFDDSAPSTSSGGGLDLNLFDPSSASSGGLDTSLFDNATLAYGAGPGNTYSSATPATGSSSSSSSGKGLSGLLQGLGLSAGTASTLASLGVTAASLAPIIGALTGSTGKGATQPTLPAQYTGAIAPVSTPSMNRTQNPSYQSMSPAQWLHYGEMPEQQFYNNNQTPTTPMSPTATPQSATPAAAGAGQNPNTPIGAYGTPNANLVASQSMYGAPQIPNPASQAAYGTSSSNLAAALAAYNSSGMNPAAPPALNPSSAPNMPTPLPITQRPVMAHGGPVYMSQSPYQSAMSSHVRGPGDGTSDDINAKLSDGEYVMDAPTVSLIGNGSNEAGARKLDAMRQNVRMHAGKHLVRGKQPMHALPPEQYMSAE